MFKTRTCFKDSSFFMSDNAFPLERQPSSNPPPSFLQSISNSRSVLIGSYQHFSLSPMLNLFNHAQTELRTNSIYASLLYLLKRKERGMAEFTAVKDDKGIPGFELKVLDLCGRLKSFLEVPLCFPLQETVETFKANLVRSGLKFIQKSCV